MKKFSLKKKTPSDGRVDKKIGGFSLKNKNAAKGKREGGKQTAVFDEDDGNEDTEKTKNTSGVVQISNVDDLVAKEDPDKPLVIVPSKQATGSIQSKLQNILAKQAEREKREIEMREKELAEENQLGLGLNEVRKETRRSTTPGTTPPSVEPLSAEITQIGGEDPTDESYSRVPVSKFGLAMLRGMGWNEELEKERRRDSKKNEPPVLQRRAPLAGLGARDGGISRAS